MPGALTAPILQIEEVIGPADQGKTLPFVCRAEDGYFYYVKGHQTNRASLWREWICAHLAQALGLPLPPFSLVCVNDALLRELPKAWQAIGTSPAFGSRQHPRSSWFEASAVGKVPVATQRDVLVFDWWVHNTDRLVGNTNLLWDTDQEGLVVIDHNLAFDREFGIAEFLQHHVFAAQWPALSQDWVACDQYRQRLIAALPAAQNACASVPEEWLWENPEMDVASRFDPALALTLLSRCQSPDLWNTTV